MQHVSNEACEHVSNSTLKAWFPLVVGQAFDASPLRLFVLKRGFDKQYRANVREHVW
jgi:hypothetical protein